MDAIRGLRTIYSGKGARLVPLVERPAAITVNLAAKAGLERDAWVRVRGGLYKDDLAKVTGGRAPWCCACACAGASPWALLASLAASQSHQACCRAAEGLTAIDGRRRHA